MSVRPSGKGKTRTVPERSAASCLGSGGDLGVLVTGEGAASSRRPTVPLAGPPTRPKPIRPKSSLAQPLNPVFGAGPARPAGRGRRLGGAGKLI